MEAQQEKTEEVEDGKLTVQLLKSRTGEFDLESILLLELRDLAIVELGCLGECANLEWLDLSGNAITSLAPLASLRALAVLNVSSNRLSSLEPLGGCESLQSLKAAGNLLHSLQELQGLRGLRRLESLCLRSPGGRLTNPLCASAGYRGALAEMFPQVKMIDGERVSGQGCELYRLCRDLDSSLQCFPGPGGTRSGPAQPWVEKGYWDVRPARRSSILEEAGKQFREALGECRELSDQADKSILQAERALSAPPEANSYLF